MTLDQFLSKYLNKGVDFDGSFGNQCVDLFRQYNKEVLSIPQPKGVVGAKDFWTNYPTDSNLNTKFTRIPNTPDGVPQAGDVVIWGAEYGPFGHIAIVLSATINSINTFSQNDPVGTLSVKKTYRSYRGVLGWIRPLSTSQGDMTEKKYTEAQMAKERDRADEHYRLYQESKTLAEQTNNKLKEEQESRRKDLETISNRLQCSPEVPTIMSKLETLVGYEDKAMELERKLQEEHNNYEKKLKTALETVDSLQKQLDMVTAELENLKENKPEPLPPTTTSFIQQILNWIFRR